MGNADNFVIGSLKKSYSICASTFEDGDEIILDALDRVIKYYLSPDDIPNWEYDKMWDDRYQVFHWGKGGDYHVGQQKT